ELPFVSDDQDDAVAGLDVLAIVAHLRLHARRTPRFLPRARARSLGGSRAELGLGGRIRNSRLRSRLGSRLDPRRLVGKRQVKRERAAFARSAFDPDFPAKQARELAADGKSESRAAVFAAGRSVGLLEGFENDLPLVFWNSDPRVRYGKRRHFFRRIQLRVSG